MADERWSSGLGFLLATVGAAVGLGNVWRFPAVLGANGGGAYLVPYLLAVALLATPLLLLELAVGRAVRADVVAAVRQVAPEAVSLGWLVVAGVCLVLSYYLVLTGWVVGFAVGWAVGGSPTFAAFTAGWAPVGWVVVATAATGLVVARGVAGGIERLARVVMPTTALLLLVLAGYGATLSGWDPALRFLFTPDPAALADPGVWSAAVGQVFFSLSVGQGIMLTYGAYTDASTDLRRSAVLIAVADVGVALVAGLVIFPVVFTEGLSPTLGTELAFTTLPAAFGALPGGRLVAVAFFGLLACAALSSAVALLEVGVAATTGATRLARPRAVALLVAAVFLAGLPSALSYSPVELGLGGRPVLDLVDESVGTYALPVSAVVLAVLFGRADLPAVRRALGPLRPVVAYLLPAVLVVVTATRAVGLVPPAWRVGLDGAGGRLLAVVVAVVVLGAVALVAALVRRRRVRSGRGGGPEG